MNQNDFQSENGADYVSTQTNSKVTIAVGPYRGLSRAQAASFIGVSTTYFDSLVKAGHMPKPKRFGSRVIWDIRALDDAFSEFGSDNDENPWDSYGDGDQ